MKAALATIEEVEPMDFEEAVRAYRPRIFRFALASLRDRDSAESVVQDCFLKAHNAWPSFRGESSVLTWLMQIAVNLIRDAARSRRFQFWKRASMSAVDIAEAGDWIPDLARSPEERASAKEQVAAIWSVLGGLPETQRTVFLLHFVEEMTGPEIEAATGISRAAVKVHLFRAVHKIRDKFGRTQ